MFRRSLIIRSTRPEATPSTGVNWGISGSPSNMPQNYADRRYQFVDNLSVLLGDHSLKLGLDYSTIPARLHIETLIPGLFEFTTVKPFDPCRREHLSLLFLLQFDGFRRQQLFLRGDGVFRPGLLEGPSRLSLNLGLRWNYYQVEDLDLDHSDIRNLNPRLGLSGTPSGTGRPPSAPARDISQNPRITCRA